MLIAILYQQKDRKLRCSARVNYKPWTVTSHSNVQHSKEVQLSSLFCDISTALFSVNQFQLVRRNMQQVL